MWLDLYLGYSSRLLYLHKQYDSEQAGKKIKGYKKGFPSSKREGISEY